MIVNGSSFSTSGQVFVGSNICTPSGFGFAETAIQCTLPPGQGANLSVVVFVSGQPSNPGNFSYDPPVISRISPVGGATGSNIFLTLTGTSFGTSGVVTGAFGVVGGWWLVVGGWWLVVGCTFATTPTLTHSISNQSIYSWWPAMRFLSWEWTHS